MFKQTYAYALTQYTHCLLVHTSRFIKKIKNSIPIWIYFPWYNYLPNSSLTPRLGTTSLIRVRCNNYGISHYLTSRLIFIYNSRWFLGISLINIPTGEQEATFHNYRTSRECYSRHYLGIKSVGLEVLLWAQKLVSFLPLNSNEKYVIIIYIVILRRGAFTDSNSFWIVGYVFKMVSL